MTPYLNFVPRATECEWITDESGSSFTFCCDPNLVGKSAYCQKHYPLMYTCNKIDLDVILAAPDAIGEDD